MMFLSASVSSSASQAAPQVHENKQNQVICKTEPLPTNMRTKFAICCLVNVLPENVIDLTSFTMVTIQCQVQ